jgi:tRNA-binding EMAP/Myf-like protein
VGDDENGPVPVVTSAPNVRLKSRVVVALAGSKVRTTSSSNTETTTMIVKPTTVGGKLSRGILCDSKMLGWTGGAIGVAVNLPSDDNVEFTIGSAPPKMKPRYKGGDGNNDDNHDAAAAIGPVTEGLFERKLSEYWMEYCLVCVNAPLCLFSLEQNIFTLSFFNFVCVGVCLNHSPTMIYISSSSLSDPFLFQRFFFFFLSL